VELEKREEALRSFFASRMRGGKRKRKKRDGHAGEKVG